MEPPCTSLGASSGSLSSSISLSDRSGGSTDCVEEYIGDVPFAGLPKIFLRNTTINSRILF